MDNVITIPNPPQAAPIYTWFLDVSSYINRFGSAKYPALMSSDPLLKAIINDLQTLHWVDLNDPTIPSVLQYMQGINVPSLGTITSPVAGMTQELATSILTTKPTTSEQQILVTLYFS